MDRTSLLFLWRYYTMTSTNCNRKIFPELEPMERKLVINSKDQWKEGSLMKKLWLLLLLVLLTGCGASKVQPQPTCGPDGPPWILHNIYDLEALKTFVDAAETPETAEQWIEENWNGSWDMLSGFEDLVTLAEELKVLPLPSFAAEQGVELTVYPDHGRDYIIIDDEEKGCSVFIYMNPQTVTPGAPGRPVKAENFQALFDQTEGILNTIRHYDGQVDGYRISFYLTGYGRKEARRFLRSLEFETLSEGN